MRWSWAQLGHKTVGLLNDLIGPPQQRRWNRQAQGRGGFEFDDEGELVNLFDLTSRFPPCRLPKVSRSATGLWRCLQISQCDGSPMVGAAGCSLLSRSLWCSAVPRTCATSTSPSGRLDYGWPRVARRASRTSSRPQRALPGREPTTCQMATNLAPCP